MNRIFAAIVAAFLSVFALPTAALASQDTVARRGIGSFGTLCCLIVIAAIVVGVVLLMRNRKR